MTSLKEINKSFDKNANSDHVETPDLPPLGTSLHKRRRGEPPATLSVKGPQTPSDAEGSSPCTAGPTPDDWNSYDTDPESFCQTMLHRLTDLTDPFSRRGKELAEHTVETIDAIDQLEKLLHLLNQIVTLKERNDKTLRRLREVEHLKKLHKSRKLLTIETEKMKQERIDILKINEALDAESGIEYGQMLFDSLIAGGRSMSRKGSKVRSPSRFAGSLLRKQRSRSAGGEDSDASASTSLRRRSDGVFAKEGDKSKKISKWTKVKAAFK